MKKRLSVRQSGTKRRINKMEKEGESAEFKNQQTKCFPYKRNIRRRKSKKDEIKQKQKQKRWEKNSVG